MRVFILLLFVCNFAYASNFGFTGLTKSDLENISDEYLANFTHTTASSPTRLGDIFGFEVGLVAGLTESPKTQQVVQRIDSSTDADKLPHAAIIGRVSVPFGLTAEATLIPTVGDENTEFSKLSLGLQWNFFEFSFFDLAAKVHYGSSTFEIKQTIG